MESITSGKTGSEKRGQPLADSCQEGIQNYFIAQEQ